MTKPLALLLLLLLSGAPPEPARVREKVDRILDMAATLDRRGWLPPDVPDLTAQVNALLAEPPDALRSVLRTALDSHPEGSEAALGSLVLVLTGAEPGEGEEFHATWETVVGGSVVLRRGYAGGFFSTISNGPAAPTVKPDPGTAFRAALSGDPSELLERPPEDVIPASAGVALGAAARRDSMFREKLLAAARMSEADSPTREILVYALGWPGTEEAGDLLLGWLDGELGAAQEIPRIESLANALRQAGRAPDALDRVRKAAASLTAQQRLWCEHEIGGDEVIGPRLAEARKDPTRRTLHTLAWLANRPYAPATTVARRLEIVALAEEILDGGDASLEGAATALLQTALWAGQYAGYGFLHYPEPPRDLAGGPKGDIALRRYFRGGWPDPRVQAARLREDLAAGRFKADCRFSTGGSGFQRRSRGERIDARAKRVGDGVVVRLTNRGESPVAVDPVAARYGIGDECPLAGDPPGRVELRLMIGCVLPGYRLLVPAAALKRIEPGKSYELRYPLKPGLHPESRIVIDYRDEFFVDGATEVPVIGFISDISVE